MKHLAALSVSADLLFAVFFFLMPQVLAVRTLTAQETAAQQIVLQGEFRNGIEIFSPQAEASLNVKIVVPEGAALPQDTKSAVLKVAVQRSSKPDGTKSDKAKPDRIKPENESEKNFTFSLPVNFTGITGRRSSGTIHTPVFEEEISVVINEKMPPVPVAFFMPENEGVYDVVLTLQYKTENLTLSNSFRQLQNPRRRFETGIITQTVCQCVVLDAKKNTGKVKKIQDLTAADLTYSDTYTIKDEPLSMPKRWTLVPALPKVGNLSSILTPDIPQFRRSGVLNEKQTAKETGTKETDSPEDISGGLPRCVSLFLEQYAEKPDAQSFSSGHSSGITLLFPDADGKVSPKSIPSISFVTQIKAANSDETEAWEALPLQIRETGVPHLLEIESPASMPSSLGVCVLDLLSGTDGKVLPCVSLKCSFRLNDEVIPRFKITAGNPVLSHKIVFYPKTKHPFLLLSNRSKNEPADIIRISVSGIAEERETQAKPQNKVIPLPDVSLPDISLSGVPQSGVSLPNVPHSEGLNYKQENNLPRRMFAAYLHQPDFWKQFADNPAVPALSSDFPNETLCPADWNVFYSGMLRLADSLKRNGYGGIMFNAVSKDSVLYPSAVLHYDSKERFVNSADRSSAKDALSLAAQIFEREKITFIPAVDFNMLLPVLENKMYYEPELSKQLLAHGSTFSEAVSAVPAGTKTGKNGERYNLLNPLVQEAMYDVLSELASRCAGYKSFGGIAVILSPDGYANLSDPSDGLDMESLRRFQEETGTALPKEILQSADIPAAFRRYFQSSPKTFENWRQWRCRQTVAFYRKAAEMLSTVRPDARLYFASGTLLDRQEINQYCQPSLFTGNPLPQIFQLLGFDLAQNALPPAASMLLPERIAAADTSESAFIYQLFNAPDFSKFWKQNTAAQNDFNSPVLFFHETENNWDVVLSAEQAGKRFVKQLAGADVPMFFDGGSGLVPVSELSAAEFAGTFQQLPAVPFRTFSKPDAQAEETIQPLTIRYAAAADGYYVYMLNNAPFPVKAKMLFRCGEASRTGLAFKELSGSRSLPAIEASGGKYFWTVELSPYDFIAVRFNDINTSLENAAAECPESICGQNGTLRRTIGILGECIKKAQQGRVWNKLENPGCEPFHNSNAVSGWELSANDNSAVQLDTVNKQSGLSSIRFIKGNTAEPAVLYSNVFPAPQTGRLFVSLNLGTAGSAVPLNVVLTGKASGKQFVRTVPVDTASLFSKPAASAAGSGQQDGIPLNTGQLNAGQSRTGQLSTVQWRSLTVPFDRLPMSGIEDLRIGFVLTQPAAVWIDDAVLYDLSFTKDELNMLYLLVSTADRRCSARRYSELLDILDGYWGQYLFRYFSDKGITEEAVLEANRSTLLTASSADTAKPSERKPETKELPKKNALSASALPESVLPESDLSESALLKSAPEQNSAKKTISEGYFDRVRKWFWRQ